MSVTRESDETIHNLQSQVVGYRSSLHGFDVETMDPVLREMGRLEKKSITTFLAKWYGMRDVPLGQKCDIIISNEGSPSTISDLVRNAASRQKKAPSIVVLCSHSSRFDRSMSIPEIDCNVSFIAKPVGPLKLAKAISQCLPGAPLLSTPHQDGSSVHTAESTDLSSVFEELSMSPRGGEVLDNSRMAADSANARKAIESPTPNASTEKHAEFPFPQAEEKPTPQKSSRTILEKESPRLLRPEIPPHTSSIGVTPTVQATASSKPLINTPAEPKPKFESPTLLLVDDNQINIRLLSTYLNRRNYAVVHEAMDGLQAVQKVDMRPEGYDIIFMDITMPVLDGFGATRQIRAIEEKRRRDAMPSYPQRLAEGRGGGYNEGVEGKAALIIAFTGRSSIEDQTEAVRVGIDLFMTKPVAFKEVGKIIDNWVANREREKRNSITDV